MTSLEEPRSSSTSWGLLVVALALLALGLVAVASAASTLNRPFWEGPIWRNPFGKQAVFAVMGVTVMLVASRLSLNMFSKERLCRWLPAIALAITVALLVVILIPGLSHARHGSQRWIRFPAGPLDLGFQPSEVAKITLVAWLAWWLGSPKAEPRKFFKGFLLPGAVLATVVILVGSEDFGTAALLAAVGGLLLLMAGCRWLHTVPLALAGATTLGALLFFVDYRMDRLRAHEDIFKHMHGAGYQPVQSLTSIATGSWSGVGLGAGIQKYGFLPESHTDFIFAVICEESGMLGAVLVLGLFSAFVWLGLAAVRSAATPFESLMAFGLTSMIGLQAVMNIAVVTVLAPTKGISLPLISAGGSGTLVYCLSIGLLIGIAKRGAALLPASEALDSVDGFEVVPTI